MKILFITHNLPCPPLHGDRLRNYHILKRVGEKHELYLLVISFDENEIKKIRLVEKFYKRIDVILMPNYGALSKPIDWFRYLLAGIPPDLRLYYSNEFCEKIIEWVSEEDFDIVNFDHSYMAIYKEAIAKELRPKTVLTFHDVLFVNSRRILPIEKKKLRKIRLWLHSKMMQHWEPQAAGEFDQVFTMSAVEKNLLLDIDPKLNIEVIPNGVDTRENQLIPEDDSSTRILFVGNMGYLPNIDAMQYFVNDIFPLIRQKISDTELWIVGKSPDRAVIDLQGNGVVVTGKVDDVRPYYQQCKVCVIPLRAGSGTRLKIIEAMALGRPVISTSVGCEGIEVIDNVHILIADEPAVFANNVIQLLENKQMRERLVNNARELVERKYGWDQIVENMDQIFEKMMEI